MHLFIYFYFLTAIFYTDTWSGLYITKWTVFLIYYLNLLFIYFIYRTVRTIFNLLYNCIFVLLVCRMGWCHIRIPCLKQTPKILKTEEPIRNGPWIMWIRKQCNSHIFWSSSMNMHPQIYRNNLKTLVHSINYYQLIHRNEVKLKIHLSVHMWYLVIS